MKAAPATSEEEESLSSSSFIHLFIAQCETKIPIKVVVDTEKEKVVHEIYSETPRSLVTIKFNKRKKCPLANINFYFTTFKR